MAQPVGSRRSEERPNITLTQRTTFPEEFYAPAYHQWKIWIR